MKKILRLTESDLHEIIKSSVKKILKEYIGDEEEFGRYDIDSDKYNMSDEEYNNMQQQLGDDTEFDDYMKDSVDDWEAEQWIGQDYYDPGPYDEYKGMF